MSQNLADPIIKKNRPVVTGPVDSNIFAVLGATTKALKRAGYQTEATACTARVFAAGSYDEALAICMQYVDFDL